MKNFMEPQIEVVTFAVEDIVTTSNEVPETTEMTFIGDCL